MTDLRKAAEELIKEWDWECGEHQNKALTDLIEAVRQALALPKREWVGLTDEEAREIRLRVGSAADVYARAIEVALKEKNG